MNKRALYRLNYPDKHYNLVVSPSFPAPGKFCDGRIIKDDFLSIDQIVELDDYADGRIVKVQYVVDETNRTGRYRYVGRKIHSEELKRKRTKYLVRITDLDSGTSYAFLWRNPIAEFDKFTHFTRLGKSGRESLMESFTKDCEKFSVEISGPYNNDGEDDIKTILTHLGEDDIIFNDNFQSKVIKWRETCPI